MVKRILGQHSRIRLLNYSKWLYQFAVPMGVYPWMSTYMQNQHHKLIQSWHIVDSTLGIDFDMFRYAWPYSYGWTESNKCTYVYLTTCEKSISYLSSMLRYCWFSVLFESFSAGMSDHTYLKWSNKFGTSMDA